LAFTIGKRRDLLQKEQVRQAVVDLVVAQAHGVRGDVVHHVDGRGALELGVDDRALHHVARDEVEDLVGALLGLDLVDVAGEQRESAERVLGARSRLGQEVAVKVVRMQDDELLGGAHRVSPRTRPASSAALCAG
jgi:hypothetical protein